MIVDYKELNTETLNNLIDQCITTEMATCNDEISNIESYRSKVLNNLKSGKFVIEFSESKKEAYIVPMEKFMNGK